MRRLKEFLDACKAGNINIVVDFVASQKQKNPILQKLAGSLDSTDNGKRTGLLLAAVHNHIMCVKALVDAGANLYAADESGSTSLHYAAWNGNLEMTAFLLTEDAKLKSQLASVANNDGMTPLHVACQQNMPDVAACLMRFNAKPLPWDATGRSPLDLACAGGHTDTVAVLLTACRSTLSGMSSFSSPFAPLEEASRCGHSAVVQQLLAAGFQVNARSGSAYRTALHAACAGLRRPVVVLLLGAGADPLARDDLGRTVPEALVAFGSAEHRRLAQEVAGRADTDLFVHSTAAAAESDAGSPDDPATPDENVAMSRPLPQQSSAAPADADDYRLRRSEFAPPRPPPPKSLVSQAPHLPLPQAAPRRSQQLQVAAPVPPVAAKRQSTAAAFSASVAASPAGPPSPKPRSSQQQLLQRVTVVGLLQQLDDQQRQQFLKGPVPPPPRPPPPPKHLLPLSLRENNNCNSPSQPPPPMRPPKPIGAEPAERGDQSQPLQPIAAEESSGEFSNNVNSLPEWQPITIDQTSGDSTEPIAEGEEYSTIADDSLDSQTSWQPITIEPAPDPRDSKAIGEEPIVRTEHSHSILDDPINEVLLPVAFEPIKDDHFSFQPITDLQHNVDCLQLTAKDQHIEPASQPIVDDQTAKQDSQPITDDQAAKQNSQPITDDQTAKQDSLPITDDQTAKQDIKPGTDDQAKRTYQPITVDSWQPIVIEGSITGLSSQPSNVNEVASHSDILLDLTFGDVSSNLSEVVPPLALEEQVGRSKPVPPRPPVPPARPPALSSLFDEATRLGSGVSNASWPEPNKLSDSVFYM